MSANDTADIPEQDGLLNADQIAAAPSPTGGNARERAVEAVVPILVEEVQVEKRIVETGRVRVSKVVREREEVVDEPLLRDEVVIDRVPVNRQVDGPLPARREGDAIVLPVVEEVVVVEKRWMLKEELRIHKRRVEARAPQRVVLREEEARIERSPPK